MTNTIVTVRTSAELEAAVEQLAREGGGTVKLAAGSYSLLLKDDAGRTDAPVRITSEDPSSPATFTSLRLSSRENLTVDNVVFDSTGTGRGDYHRDLDILNSKGVTIADSVFRGGATETLDGTPGQLRGTNIAMQARNSDDIVLRDNHLSGYNHGISVLESNDVLVTGNELTGLQGDGIRMGGVQDVLVQGNHLHTMLGASADINHSDMIQLWGANIRQNNERVTIRENIVDTSDGAAYQMIFGNNIHLQENGFLFKDIVVEGNVLHGANHNMIAISQTDGIVIRHNTVLWNRDAHVLLAGGEVGHSVPGRVTFQGDENAVIENNIAAQFIGASGPNGVLSYDDMTSDGYYAAQFVNLDAGGTGDLRDLTLRPGSEWDGVFGSPLTWSTRPVTELTATALVDRVQGDRSKVVLDARLTRDADGLLDGATYVWTFADGTERTGAVIEHDFGTPGEHRYTLAVRTADGRTDTIERKVDVSDPELLVLDLDGGAARDASSYRSGVAVEGDLGPDGFRMGGDDAIEVSRGAGQIYSLDCFALALDVTLDAGTDGTLVELWKSFHGRVDAQGRFVFDITTTTGDFTVATGAGAVPTGTRVEIGVEMDGPAGELRLLIDGEVEGSADVSGLTLPRLHWGMTLGNKFSGHSVEGVLHGVVMRGEPSVDADPGVVVVEDTPASDGAAPADDGAAGDEGADETPAEEAGVAPPVEALIAWFDFDDDVADASARRTGAAWDEAALRFAEGSDGTGRSVALGDRDDGVVLGRGAGHMHGLDAFHVAFDLRRADLEKGGSLLHSHQTMTLKLDDAGRLILELATDEGSVFLRTEDAVVTDGAWHEVEVAYSDAAGRVELSLDGAMLEFAELTGTTSAQATWGLALGRLWGGEAPAHLDDFRMWDEAALRGAPAPMEAEEDDDPAGEDAGIEAQSVSTSAAEGDTLAAFAFDGDLTERDGRRVGVWASDASDFVEGRDGGQALRIGDDARVALTRENAFLHERDAFAFSFDLRKDDADGKGRVLHFGKTMEAAVAGDELVFTLQTDEGRFAVATKGGALDDADWHAVEVGYDDAADRLTLAVDGREFEARAGGATAEAGFRGLSLGAAWGDALEGAIDDFEMRAEPDWSLA